ncbi:MAG: DNA (cytosine-5-)-methyltransferase [Ktedonobacteraceae bacterium]
MMTSKNLQDFLPVLRKKTFAEFFAGIGLVRAGLERQGWTIEFANDISQQKYEMYKGQYENADEHFLLEDIHAIPVEVIPSVTLATASFPCNDLSLAGGRNGLQGEHSSAFWGFISILKQMHDHKPPLVILENVTGFLTSNNGEDFRQGLLALNNLGYTVDTFILDAANFVPQSRQRLFVIGILETLHTYDPESSFAVRISDTRPKALAMFILEHPDIRWHIRPLPSQPTSNVRLNSILEDLAENASEWWLQDRATYLLSQMSSHHRQIAEQMIVGNEWSYGTVFRRMRKGKSTAELRVDGIAGCLRTPRGGSAKQILFKAGKGQYFARLITPREASRLMGAGFYTITVPFDQALFGFGDAVCVPVIEWIASNYLNPTIEEIVQRKFNDHGTRRLVASI